MYQIDFLGFFSSLDLQLLYLWLCWSLCLHINVKNIWFTMLFVFTGDVLVNVCDRCVLGYSHQDIVNLFQTIPPNQSVTLTVCRGYPLPFDPDDPNTEIIVTVAVTLPNDSNVTQQPPSYSYFQETRGVTDQHNTSAKSMKSLPDLTRSTNIQLSPSSSNQPNGTGEAPDVLGIQKPEILTINIVRGEMGFGFTIADSVYGQKVKQILDKPRCKNLQEGDILQRINDTNVQEMAHSNIVQVLKECPKNVESRIIVQRGGRHQLLSEYLVFIPYWNLLCRGINHVPLDFVRFNKEKQEELRLYIKLCCIPFFSKGFKKILKNLVETYKANTLYYPKMSFLSEHCIYWHFS